MVELNVTSKFDPDRCRQYLNDELSVFHCHHYATLFTQLADDAKLFDGERHLTESSSEAMLPPMKKYCEDNAISSIDDKISIAEQYFSYVGLGKVDIDVKAWSATMQNAHVDEGWIKKWGNRDEPVNFIGQGFIVAAFALAHGGKPSSYKVTETQSIVSGAATSKFIVEKI